MQVKLTEEQLQLLKTGNVIYTSEKNTYFYLPYWYVKDEEGNIEQINFEQLPEKVTQYLQTERKYYGNNS